MNPTFKKIHVNDAIKAYDVYISIGRPAKAREFEMLMTQYMIDKVNNTVSSKTTVSLNEKEFNAYSYVINHTRNL